MNQNLIYIDKVYNENCLDTMARMEDGFIDLTVTSPPYDNLRTYNGFSFDFEKVAKELFRVTKDGGVVVWVVGDATIKGSETGTSFRQALYFMDCGFNLHDTMIYEKSQACFGSTKCYLQSFEYMFIFTKGTPISINFIRDRENVRGGKTESTVSKGMNKNGNSGKRIAKTSDILGKRKNIWKYGVGGGLTGHPAVFPEQLAKDHIISWSNEHDLVYDPFMGSGTTAKMAILNKRNYIGSEISEEYTAIANKRIASIAKSLF